MRCLITGGAGFIGSHLTEALLKEGHEVAVIDNLSTGKIDNLAMCDDHARFRFVHDSITNQPIVESLVAWSDVVFHLAAAVGVALVVRSPVATIETNVFGTEVVLQAAARYRRKVLITSTSEVYGKAEKVPFSEGDDLVFGPTTRGRWSYACSKAFDEFLALAYWRDEGVPTVVCRLFNTIGPRQTGQYGMVVPRFIDQALANKPVTVFGDGQQSRCFCDVADVVKALMALVDHPGAIGEIFNVGTDREITITSLAKLVCQLTGSTSDVVFVPYEQVYGESFEDMRRRVPNLEKVHQLVGYTPQYTLEDTIERIIQAKRREMAPS